MKFSLRLIISFAVLFLILTAVYANHFDNAFQFDDSHTIEENTFIRDLRFIPHFFKDATMFSSLPTNQSYRPVVSASLAIDYWLAGGLEPFYFHLSTYLWYVLFLILLFLLLEFFLQKNIGARESRILAFCGTAFFAFHPVSAETVNYIIQRAEVYVNLTVVLAFLLYFTCERARRYYLYLLPIVVGTLSKPTALMFVPLLFLAQLFFEQQADLLFWKKENWPKYFRTIATIFPAALAFVALYLWQDLLTSETFTPGGYSAFHYLITQPYVAWIYFYSYFLPIGLSADTDLRAFDTVWQWRCLFGFFFISCLTAAIFYCSKYSKLRVISFGLAWFLITLLPTSLIPLAEVMNDHRMFLPFIGLSLVVFNLLGIIDQRFKLLPGRATNISPFLVVYMLAVMPIYAFGTYQRNEVWHSAETLWLDVSIKSPANGRGLMNYGLTQMAQGKYDRALEYFLKAKQYTPRYSTLEINLGVVYGAIGNEKAAEQHFQAAINFSPNLSDPYFYYGRWLNNQSRVMESLHYLEQAFALNKADFKVSDLLLNLYHVSKQEDKVQRIIFELQKVYPDYVVGDHITQKIASIEDQQKEGARYLQQSLAYFNQKQYGQVIVACEMALKLRPNYALAYNNIAAAQAELGNWQASLDAAQQAVKLEPDFQLAINNLNYAKEQLKQQLK